MFDKYWWVVPGFLIFLGIAAIAGTNHAADQMAEKYRIHKTWKHKCIDAGGTPVTVLDYVRGVGEGDRCIKSIEVLEVK